MPLGVDGEGDGRGYLGHCGYRFLDKGEVMLFQPLGEEMAGNSDGDTIIPKSQALGGLKPGLKASFGDLLADEAKALRPDLRAFHLFPTSHFHKARSCKPFLTGSGTYGKF